MQPYNQVVILNSGRKVDLSPWKIGEPQETLFYMPPYWAGPMSIVDCGRPSRGESLEGLRQESIPKIKEKYANYLICDDYLSEGDTMEIAAIRLMEAGANPELIWVYLTNAKDHWGDRPILDSLVAFHKLLKGKDRFNKNMLQNVFGIVTPCLKDYLI
jgi:hypothetical protein